MPRGTGGHCLSMTLDPAMTDKQILRRKMRALRSEVAARDPDAGERLAENFPMKLYQRYGPHVSAYLPISDEIDPMPLLRKLSVAGAKLSLPRIEADDRLTFRRWQLDEPLESGRFGLREPADTAEIVSPTLLLVPLLAYDDTGTRLGYGKGHYDRALQDLRTKGRVFACALAFQAQHVDAIPCEVHDQPMDWAVTEAGNTPLFMIRAMRKAHGGPESPDAA